MINPTCTYCKKDPGAKPGNPNVWFGFLDKDTNQYVCWNCRNKHYETKNKTEHAHKYSEYPVMYGGKN